MDDRDDDSDEEEDYHNLSWQQKKNKSIGKAVSMVLRYPWEMRKHWGFDANRAEGWIRMSTFLTHVSRVPHRKRGRHTTLVHNVDLSELWDILNSDHKRFELYNRQGDYWVRSTYVAENCRRQHDINQQGSKWGL